MTIRLAATLALATLIFPLSLGGCPTDATQLPDDGSPSVTPSGNDTSNNNDQSSGGDSNTDNTGDNSTGDTNNNADNGSNNNTGGGDNTSDPNTPSNTGGGGDTAADPNVPSTGGGDTGGGDTGGGDTGGTPAAIAGTFTGSVNFQVTVSLGGATSEPHDVTLEFNNDGVLQQVFVPGFHTSPDRVVDVTTVGNKLVFEDDLNGSPIKQTIRVDVAQYTGTSAHIELFLRHRQEQGQLLITGTGSQIVDITLNNDAVDYMWATSYATDWDSPATQDPIEVQEAYIATGSLAR